ncbi:hypothetical protein L484_021860 [Morus notabilis]|uniref:Uncharacterized protein n=1 Tax=Morus notabilis TaxID=981085 RepID=W9QQA4_9ROSA|nr:uncharacterized protein LOC21404699 [Morus notabilis]EXB37653.1 hypothetical protein L484_021860 [Morus notabilis]
MDREPEELQFLGAFGIYKEAYKIIFSLRKIFSQITLALILPMSLIFLIHKEISNALFRKILINESNLDQTIVGSPKYNKLSHLISTELITLWLFKVAYFTFLLIFSLLSTSAVVYTIACIYTGKEATFKKVMSVVPKVWKRLMVTFLWTFLAFSAYNIAAVIVLFAALLSVNSTYDADLVIGIVLVIAYLLGFVYLSLIWHLACVVSVLEDIRGIEAMNKSKGLIRGKTGVAMIIFSKLAFSVFVLQFAFQRLVVDGWSLGVVDRVGYGIICLLVLLKLVLFALVIQTVLYFVCKSYHHEGIDKSALSDHLDVYQLGEYVPLKAKDVQLEQFEV